MGINEVKEKPIVYRGVTFQGAKGKKMSIQIPIGTKVEVNQKNYEIRNDGVYLNGKKVENLSIPDVQFAALKAFDVDGNGRIDSNDSKLSEQENDGSIAGQINENIPQDSKFYVRTADTDSGSIEDAGIYEGLFGAAFRNKNSNMTENEISIELPKKQNDSQSRMTLFVRNRADESQF